MKELKKETPTAEELTDTELEGVTGGSVFFGEVKQDCKNIMLKDLYKRSNTDQIYTTRNEI